LFPPTFDDELIIIICGVRIASLRTTEREVPMAYVVLARWTAREGEEDAVAAALSRLIGPSRAEPGCLVYQPHRDPADPRVFVIYERYSDAGAYRAHGESGHFAEHAIGDAFERLESRERDFLETWDGEA
jgi:quinol monooxygenase YgiN